MSSHSHWFIQFLRQASLILFKILFAFLMSPVLFILMALFLLIFFVRLIVKYMAKLLRPDLANMVTCSGSAVANIDNEIEKPRFAVLVKFTFSGTIDLQRLQEIARSQVFYLKTKDGKLKYPEMQQYLTSWLGFRFWKQDTDFDLNNHSHVINLGKKIVTEEDLRELSEELLIKPFHAERSPWDVHLVHNVQLNSKSDSNHTAFFFRFSHILGDGFALLKFFINFCKIEETPKIKTKYPSRSVCENLLFPLKFFYTYAEIAIQYFTRFPFKVRESDKRKEYHMQTSDVVSAEDIKQIKNKMSIGFTSAVCGIVSGVMREIISKKGLPMPDVFPCLLPFPKPNHPDKLRNHFTLASLKLPVGEPDPVKRMRICDKEYDQLKHSVFPVVTDFSIRLSGVCFKSLGKFIGENNFGVVNTSYIPVSWDRCTIDDHELRDFSFCMGIQRGSIGLSISICSFKDRIVFNLVADKAVLSKQDVLQFKQIVNQEIDGLKKLCISTEV